MKLVIIESPFAGDLEANREYALSCLADSIARDEAPFASHLLYPLVLDDKVKEERLRGMVCGFAWMERADLVAVYIDRGVSNGMKEGIKRATDLGIPIDYRSL